MIVDDFVMLGKTVPEVASDGRQFVCTAGFSFELRQPIRVYPMARRNCPPRWSTSRVPLERNPNDSRRESWKIRGDRRAGAHDQINSIIEVVDKKLSVSAQREIVALMTAPSLRHANEERRSLCVLLPATVPQLALEPGETAQMAPTPDLFGATPDLSVAQRFRWHPRLRFTDQEGCAHDLMLRDWGCYELIRKHGEQHAHRLDEALNLSVGPPLLCGNLNRFRNSWLIISVFGADVCPAAGEQQASLFEFGTAMAEAAS
jgi:hypothetical protein